MPTARRHPRARLSPALATVPGAAGLVATAIGALIARPGRSGDRLHLEVTGIARQAVADRVITVEATEHGCTVAIPLVRNDRVIGLLMLERDGEGFDRLEQEVFPLVGDQVALAVAGQMLHAGETLAAVRDLSTGLFTEAFAEAALQQIRSLRSRTAAAGLTEAVALVLGIDGFDALARTDQDSADAALRRLAACSLTTFGGAIRAGDPGQGLPVS